MNKYLFMLVIMLAGSTSWAQSGDLIVLVDELDEPEFYCIDLAGWGQNLQLDQPLQTHTCKTRNADDQMFHFDGDHLKISKYEGCIQAAGSSGVTLPGSAVTVSECSDENALQKLALDEAGKLRLTGTDYCLVAGEESAEASGPSHMWRTLTVAECGSVEPALATWQIGI